MPIVINGGSRSAGGWWARHLGNMEKNERAELIEMRGLTAETMPEAFREMYAVSLGTKCDNYFYQANINPREDEHLTPAQWEEAVDTLEKNLGLTDQPRFVVEHEKHGRTHRHVVWSRIDAEQMVAISDSLTAAIHERTSRELEIKFDLERGRSILVPDRDFERPERRPKNWETFRGADSGLDPRAITAEVTELWRSADSGQSFKAALEDRGYILTRGDRRDFVIIDRAGDDHSLARRLEGVKAADVRARMVDVDREQLASVQQGQAQQRERQAAREATQAHVQGEGRAAPAEAQAATQDKQPERPPLGKTAGEIRLAWRLTQGAEGFAAALAERGIGLAQATADEARASERARAFAKEIGRAARALREGEIVAVNGRGDVFRIDQRTTSDLRAEIDKRLGTLDAARLASVTETRAAMREASRAAWIAQKQEERAQEAKSRPPTGTERRVLDALKAGTAGPEFAAALDKAGVTLARVTGEDVKRLDAEREAVAGVNTTRVPRVRENEIVAVTRLGIARLNPHRVDIGAVEQRMAGVENGIRAGVDAAREKMAERRAAHDREAMQRATTAPLVARYFSEPAKQGAPVPGGTLIDRGLRALKSVIGAGSPIAGLAKIFSGEGKLNPERMTSDQLAAHITDSERQAATQAANTPPPQPATGFVQPRRRLSVEAWRAEEQERRVQQLARTMGVREVRTEEELGREQEAQQKRRRERDGGMSR